MSEEIPSLRACIEGAGYDWDEVWPPTASWPPPKGSVWVDREFQQVYQACGIESGFIEVFSQERIAKESRETLKYVACMRRRGWKLPDPEPSDSVLHPGLLDRPSAVPEDPEAANQYYRDTNDCGFPFYDEKDNLLPLEDG